MQAEKHLFAKTAILGRFLRNRAAEGRKVSQKKPLSSVLSRSIVNWPGFFQNPDRPDCPAPEIFSLSGRSGIDPMNCCSRIFQARTPSDGQAHFFQRRSGD